VLAPGLAGWRGERAPSQSLGSSVTLPPDWVCEVICPDTSPLLRASRLPTYAREGIRYVWLVNPERRTLEVLHLEGHRYTLRSFHAGEDTVRAEPFGVLELPLRLLWAR
jgi:Uma2 family endonuclease